MSEADSKAMHETQVIQSSNEALRPKANSTAMLVVLTVVAMLSGFLVVMMVQLTAPAIAENKRLAIEKAVFQVIPGAVERRDFHLDAGGSLIPGEGPDTLYAGYDADGKLLGVAIEGSAQGYADSVRQLWGYGVECQCVTAFTIIKFAETPGLGDKVLTDAGFLANFGALEARLNAAGDALANAIVTVKHGTKKHPWEVDAISGATITSRAVGKGINDSAQHFLPHLVPQLDVLRAPKAASQGE